MKITTQVPDVQLKTYEEATLLSLDPTEIEDLAASLSLAAAKLRRTAGEVPTFEQRKQLCEQAQRIDQMLARLLDHAGEDLKELTCSSPRPRRFDVCLPDISVDRGAAHVLG